MLGVAILATPAGLQAEEVSVPPTSPLTPTAPATPLNQVTTASQTGSASSDTSEVHPDPTGFYPIWESTGFVLPHRKIHLATNGAEFGINNIGQIGVQPISFLYRSPNINAKFQLLKKGPVSLATQVGATFLLAQASRAFLSPMYSSRLDNPDFSITLVPVSLTSTIQIADWLQVHQSLTGLSIFGQGPVKTEMQLGYSAVAEFMALARHSVLLHAAEVGIGNHDFSLLGASYRYQNNWFEFRLGYFYRMRTVGTQASPLIAFGFWF